MLNFSKDNLLAVSKEKVAAGTPAIKVNDMVILLEGGTSGPTGGATAFYKCAEVGTGTWTGYKAYFVDDTENDKKYYDFETELTTDTLTYGSGFTPEVGSVYNAEALIKAELRLGNFDVTAVAVQSDSYSAASFFVSSTAAGVIDWGDGSTSDITAGDSVLYSHDYASGLSEEHIIKVKGSGISHIKFNGNYSGSHYSIYTRLIQLGNSLTSLQNSFESFSALQRIEDTVQIPSGVTSMNRAFYACSGLSYVNPNLRLPKSCINFHRAFQQASVPADITHWFDDFADISGANIDFSRIFNVAAGVTGTVPADLLWNNPNITFSVTTYAFSGCTGLTNYNEIPSAWGGGGE